MACIAATSVFALTACSMEPGARVNPGSNSYVHIFADPESTESFVLGKMYETVLDKGGRPATLRMSSDSGPSHFDSLHEGETDLIIGCAGQLLEHYNPNLAAELEAEYTTLEDADPAEWREKTYDALLSSLPGMLAATDPSNAQACTDANGLPQNVVPLYRKPNLPREHREMLNWTSGAFSTKELSQLVEKAEKTGSATTPVEEFLSDKGL